MRSLELKNKNQKLVKERDSFETIAKNYKAIFFDAFGVLKNHNGLIDGVHQTFEYLSKQGIDYYLLTNDASKSQSDLANYYFKKGLFHINSDRVISSGMLTQEYLRMKLKPGIIAYLGTKKSADYLGNVGHEPIAIGDLDMSRLHEVRALVFLDDEGFDWREDINKTINLLREVNVPAIISNTDKTYPLNKEQVALAIGGVADMIESVTGRTFLRFGKPDTQMFQYAYEHASRNGGLLDKREILMVGDTLHTDILGGNKFGLDTMLVLTGNTDGKNVNLQIEQSGIVPTHICESVGSDNPVLLSIY